MPPRPFAAILPLAILVLLPGCVSPRWVAPVNPLQNTVDDRAAAALKAKDYPMALHFYGQRVENEPDNMVALYQLAEVNRAMGRLEVAYGYYRTVYVSGVDEDTPLANGDTSDEPLYKAAERQVRMLRARLGIEDGRMGGKQPEK